MVTTVVEHAVAIMASNTIDKIPFFICNSFCTLKSIAKGTCRLHVFLSDPLRVRFNEIFTKTRCQYVLPFGSVGKNRDTHDAAPLSRNVFDAKERNRLRKSISDLKMSRNPESQMNSNRSEKTDVESRCLFFKDSCETNDKVNSNSL